MAGFFSARNTRLRRAMPTHELNERRCLLRFDKPTKGAASHKTARDPKPTFVIALAMSATGEGKLFRLLERR
jgi:hypothetical protein